MTHKEFAMFSMALKTYYPRENLLPTNEAMELWYRELMDIGYEIAQAALRKWVGTEKWPPSIAEIRSMAAEITSGPVQEWGEGWLEVKRAVSRFGWCREKEALASLSPAARTAAQRIGWQDICCSENPETLRAQFRQVFQVEAQRQRQDALMTPELKQMISGISGKMNLLKDGKA